MLLGNKVEAAHGRYVVRMLASTGQAIDRITLDRAVQAITTTRQGLFAIGETDDGYVMYAIRVGK